MNTNAHNAIDWRSVVIWSMTLFLWGVVTAQRYAGSGLNRLAIGLVTGVLFALVGGLVVGGWKYFKRSIPTSTYRSQEEIRKSDKALFGVAIVLAIFFVGKALYLKTYGSLIDAVILIVLGLSILRGIETARWIFAIYAFVTPMLVIAQNGVGAYIWPFVFYFVCRSLEFGTTSKLKVEEPKVVEETTQGDVNPGDAVYAQIDDELETKRIDRPTWIRAEGDAEGNAERTRALYIKYRAQRLLTSEGATFTKQESGIDNGTSKKPVSHLVMLGLVTTVALVGIAYMTSETDIRDRESRAASKSAGIDWSQYTPVEPQKGERTLSSSSNEVNLARTNPVPSEAAITWIRKASELEEKNDLAGLMSAAEEFVRNDPNSDFAWSMLGTANNKVANHTSAIKAFKQALKLNPKSTIALNGLGGTFIGLKDYSTALDYFQQTSRIDPNNTEAWFKIGILYSFIGPKERALDAYEKLRALDPQMAAELNSKFIQR